MSPLKRTPDVTVNLDVWTDGDLTPLAVARGLTRGIPVTVRRIGEVTPDGELIQFSGPARLIKDIARNRLGDEFNEAQVENL